MIGAFVVYDLQYVMNYIYIIYNMCIYIYSVHVCVIIYIIMYIYNYVYYSYTYHCIFMYIPNLVPFKSLLQARTITTMDTSH